MKKVYLLIVIMFFGCSNSDDDINIIPPIQSYHIQYMDHPKLAAIYPVFENLLVSIEYSQNKITRKIGGYLTFDYLTGVNIPERILFFKDIYDELSYINNEIIIETKSTEYTVYSNKRIIKLDKQGGMIKKTTLKKGLEPWVSEVDTVTISYTYSNSNKISKSITKYRYSYDEASYYYNTHNNIDSIVTITKFRFDNEDFIPTQKTVEIFSDFDTFSNPTKKLNIFEETFNRSLSENNYRKYEKNEFGLDYEWETHQTRTWEYYYDNENNIQFNK